MIVTEVLSKEDILEKVSQYLPSDDTENIKSVVLEVSLTPYTHSLTPVGITF